MATNIRLKSSSVSGKTPSLSDLALRELAVNTVDGKLFLRKGNGSASDKIVDVTAFLQTSEPMGHEDGSQSAISFNPTTRVFTIQPSSSSFNVWCKGIKYNFTTPKTLTIPNTTGLYYIYFDTDGNLQYKTTFFDLEFDTPTAYVYWNASTNSAPFIADERHGITLDWQTHEYLHRTRGAVIANGFSISNYTTSGTGSNNSDAQFDLSGGTFFDEDLEVIITHSNTPTPDTWQQDLQGPAQIPVFYMNGTGWVRDTPTNYALKTGTSRIQYNFFNGASWSAQDVPSNTWYTTSWIIATNNINYPVLAVMGQTASNKLSDEEVLAFGSLTLDGFPVVEYRPLWKIIWQTDSGYANTPKARIAGVYDIRQLSSGGGYTGATPVSDHGLLTGLGDDDHLQYFHLTEPRIGITAPLNTTGQITTTNKIGIGTTVPQAKIHVTENSSNTLVNLTHSGTGNIVVIQDDNLTTKPIIINSSGFVGIGTLTPTSVLHLAGIGTTSLTGDDNRLRIGDFHWDRVYTTIHAKKARSEWWLEQNSQDTDGVDLIFYKSRGVPGAELPVQVDDNVFRLTGRVYRQDSTRVGSSMTTDDWGGDSLAQIAFDVDQVTTNVAYGRIDFRTQGASRMMIKSSGNIGIGTTNPETPLDIFGASAQLRVRTGTVDCRILPLTASAAGLIGTWSNHDLVLNVNNTERLRIVSSNGYIGIGTTNPSARLQIGPQNGSHLYLASVNNSFGWRLDTFDFNNGSVPFRIFRRTNGSDTESLTILNQNGNVGIGTTLPSSTLSVNGFITENPGDGTYWNVVTQKDIGFNPNQVPLNQYLGQLAFADTYSPSGLRRDGGGADDLIVDSSGRILIGTTSARGSYVFQIEGTTYETSSSRYVRYGDHTISPGIVLAKVRGSTVGSNGLVLENDRLARIEFQGANGTDLSLAALIEGYVDGTASSTSMPGRIVFQTVPSGSLIPQERMRISNSGNVGIGAINPSTALQVENSSSTYVGPGNNSVPTVYLNNTNNSSTSAHSIFAARVGGSSGGNPFIAFDIVGVTGWSAGIDNADGDKFKISNSWTTLSNNTRLTIDSTGNIGIGTTNPTSSLHVQGTSLVTGNATFQGNVFLGDNDSIYLGDGNDLRIYSDGSNSYIQDDGPGVLAIRGSNATYLQSTSGEYYFIGNENGSVELYFDNSKKFETTTNGVTVTGTINTTGSYETTNTLFGQGSASITGGIAATINQLSATTYRSVEYTIQATVGTNYHVTKILAIHNGTDVNVTEYGTIITNTSVATYSVDISGGNIVLTATPTSASTTSFKIAIVALKV